MGSVGQGKSVCVTGASGYIASWIIKLIPERGYIVNATVRNLKDPKKTKHLLALDGAKERLHLFEANLMDEGSFDAAIQGCHGVFHTASPVKAIVINPQEELIDPAVKGTLNVLSSCAKNSTIKRVVLTSSMASVQFTGKPLTPEVVVDETWFSTPEGCEQESMKYYLLSKTLAEEAVWKFVKENDIDLVSINPYTVIGPSLNPTLSPSLDLFLRMIHGDETFLNANIGWVHVKDVANAHVLALEIPSSNGRYLLTESVARGSEIVMLGPLGVGKRMDHKCEKDESFEPAFKISKQKVQNLGINYIPLKTSIKETVEFMKEKKFINF